MGLRCHDGAGIEPMKASHEQKVQEASQEPGVLQGLALHHALVAERDVVLAVVAGGDHLRVGRQRGGGGEEDRRQPTEEASATKVDQVRRGVRLYDGVADADDNPFMKRSSKAWQAAWPSTWMPNRRAMAGWTRRSASSSGARSPRGCSRPMW